jgi:hypothetical protein
MRWTSFMVSPPGFLPGPLDGFASVPWRASSPSFWRILAQCRGHVASSVQNADDVNMIRSLEVEDQVPKA